MSAIYTGPPALTVNIMENTESSSVVQWDAVDDSLTTFYTVTWTSEATLIQSASLTERTSFTILGLSHDTVYNVTVTAANKCGGGPEFMTNVLISTGMFQFY